MIRPHIKGQRHKTKNYKICNANQFNTTLTKIDESDMKEVHEFKILGVGLDCAELSKQTSTASA